jgi:nucleotide-binding universal stress UspA family protein
MNKSTSTRTLPAKILLATDLSARCDRALERAAQLAKEWQAKLIALNVIDVPNSPDQVLAWIDNKNDETALNIAKKQMARDVSGLGIEAAMHVIRSADTSSSIQHIAAVTNSDMVITGMARNELLGRFLLGSTVKSLATSLPLPLLVVRNRVHGSYQRIVVATDFSEHSRQVLLLASRLFPGRELIVYHAHEIPFDGVASKFTEINSTIEQGEYTAFIKNSKLPSGVLVKPAIELGTLAPTLTQYVRTHEVDLVFIGANSDHGLLSNLLGSSASKLLDWLPCDTLVARSARDMVLK